ncbi:MAG: hypothetical protein P8104_01755 [Gammaproteobacteria bacterium]
MVVRRAKAAGKRGFRGYASPVQPGWNNPGGGGGSAAPFALTMHSVRLTEEPRAFGQDETRKRNQRKLFWYWQWSRDWEWRQVTTIFNIQPDVTDAPKVEEDGPDKTKEWVWFWRWREYCRARNRKRYLPRSKEKNPILEWISRLNRH